MNAEDLALQTQDALTMVHLRNAFYRRKFRFVLGLYALSLIGIAMLICIIVYLLRHPTEPLFFPIDQSGKLIQEVPLSSANMSLQDVTAWAVDAVESAFSYDFMNYRAQLQDTQKYFTSYGWGNYMKALQQASSLVALTVRKEVIISRVAAPPKLITQGVLGGALAWKFQMPLLVRYFLPPTFDAQTEKHDALDVTVIVQRQDVLQSYKGLGVVQIIATNATVPID